MINLIGETNLIQTEEPKNLKNAGSGIASKKGESRTAWTEALCLRGDDKLLHKTVPPDCMIGPLRTRPDTCWTQNMKKRFPNWVQEVPSSGNKGQASHKNVTAGLPGDSQIRTRMAVEVKEPLKGVELMAVVPPKAVAQA